MTVQAALPAPTAAAPSRSDAGDAQPRDAASEALEGDCQEQLYDFLQRYFGQVRQRPRHARWPSAAPRQLSLTPLLSVLVGPAARTGAAGYSAARR